MNLTLTLSKTNYFYIQIKLLLTLKSNIMRKIKLFLATMLSIFAWTGAMAQTAVTDVSQLSNTKVYTIECPRGALVLNNNQDALVSSHKSTKTAVNDKAATDEASKQFCIIKYDGLYYLYSPKLKKFAGLKGQDVAFSNFTHVAFQITTDGTGGLDGSVFRLKAPKFNYYINNNNGGGIVLNSYSTPEGGNTMTFYEVEGASVNEEEVLAALCTEYLDDHKVYKINNLRVTTWTANADGTALTGTKAYAAASEAYQQFAFINRDGNLYMYNLGTKKFLGLDGDNVILTSDKTKFTPIAYSETYNQTYPFKFFLPAKNWYFNGQNTGGFLINAWSSEDDGNRHQLVEVNQVNVYDEMLDYFESPYWDVTYNVYYNGTKVDEAVVNCKRNAAPDLPVAKRKPFMTYTYDKAAIEDGVTEVNVTATWNGPFVISSDFATAHWYDMAMRNTWYVTSDVKDNDGAYKTQNANTMGLVEDSYQWAFIGNPWEGFKIINKAAGEGKSFGWVDDEAKNQGIPTIMADDEGNHAWNIIPSTNTTVAAGSFCLNIPGTNLSINQYGGAGGSVKFWDSTGNIGDAGSAFTVFDVPTNFAAFVKSEISPAFEADAKYFVLTDAAKTGIGYDPAYKEECPFETYKSLKEKLTAAMSDATNFVLPETGHYILKNKNYGTYMGIDPTDANMYGNYQNVTAAKHIVKLTKNNDNTYTIGLMGKFAPATVAASADVTASSEAGNYTVVVTTPGYVAFQADTEQQYSCLHCAKGSEIVGWEASADASQWEVIDATTVDYTIGEEGYATAYMPCPVNFAETVPVTIPEAKGVWTFDNPENPMAGKGTATMGATGGVTIADGVVTVPVGDKLIMNTNANATELKNYTFMMDIMVPADKGSDESLNPYTALFQNKPNNDDDGSFFIYWHKTNGRKIGVNSGGLGYGGSIELGTWYRVVFVSNNSTATVYVNGEKTGAATSAVEQHWTLKDRVLFFADNDGEENMVKTSEIRFWDQPLTAEQVAVLSTVGTNDMASSSETGVKAYSGKINGNYLTLNEINGIVPEKTPVVLKGNPGTYSFLIPKDILGLPHIENDLEGTLEPIDATGKYVLAQPEGEKIGFYLANEGEIAATKAYIDRASNTGPLVKAFYFNGDGTTSINSLTPALSEGEGAIYNIAGQRINKLQKGINIVNGKKILK